MHTSTRTAVAAALLLAADALAAPRAAAQVVTKDAPAPTGAAPRREQPPALGTPRGFTLPAGRTLTLSNGMRVTLVPFGTVPKATVRLFVRTGNIDERAGETWLADLTGDLMGEGTTTLSAQQIAETAAGMGGSLAIGVGMDQTSVGGDVLGERAPEMVRLVSDVVLRPAMPASELPRLKANRLRTLAVQRASPQSQAAEKFAQTMYGDHPYGRYFPTQDQLQGYTIDQVRAFHAANFGAARAQLYVVGVFDQAAVERAAREAFGEWTAGAPATKNPPQPKSARSLALVDRPNAVQSTVVLGLPVANPTNADWTALQVTDALLGGAFGSRITSNIREQKGYTYSPFSTLSTHVADAVWMQQADVTTNVTGASLTEIFKEIDRLRAEAPPAQELDGIKQNLAGVFVLQNGSRGGITSQLQFVNLHGLGEDYLSGYVKRVLGVTPTDVRRVAQEYLVPGKMTITVVGDRKTVEPQLAPFVTVTP
ncbi:MAG: M16 family metallopeptidase [Gemmatirosa sp.]